MFSHTKRVGSVGRYGIRVGKKIREELKKVETSAKKRRVCPTCGRGGVKRKFSGVWECSPCKTVFTGGAYLTKLRGKKEEVVEGVAK